MHHGKYLDSKLRKEHLYILDKTTDVGFNRGEGIRNWIKEHPVVESWIVLDDDVFDDYDKFDIIPHLIKTSFYSDNGGLQSEHVNEAIKILNGADYFSSIDTLNIGQADIRFKPELLTPSKELCYRDLVSRRDIIINNIEKKKKL